MLGVDGAGKTTLLEVLQGEETPSPAPTVGFTPVRMALSELVTVQFYDLGGSIKFRGTWHNYFHDCHATCYVVDAATLCTTLILQRGLERSN